MAMWKSACPRGPAASRMRSASAGGRLAQAADATVPGTSSTAPPPAVPVTASFSGALAEHDGTGSFELQFRLSEEPAGLSYRTVQSGLFDVSGGSIGRAWRLQNGNNAGWGLRIEPSGFGDVTLVVRATTDCAGTPGVCTSDGRMLGGGLQVTIAGPPTLSVADAVVDEGSGAVLDFAVTLSRALRGSVTVGYRTADGSANAGADYTNTTGTLTFAAGDTSKTVSVPVLDDEHDEGSETMTLRLQSPNPARVKLADAEATGTIHNTDAMPQAWLARFGRTVGEQAMEAVEGRFGAARTPGLSGSIGGQPLSGLAGAEAGAAETKDARGPGGAHGLALGQVRRGRGRPGVRVAHALGPRGVDRLDLRVHRRDGGAGLRRVLGPGRGDALRRARGRAHPRRRGGERDGGRRLLARCGDCGADALALPGRGRLPLAERKRWRFPRR